MLELKRFMDYQNNSVITLDCHKDHKFHCKCIKMAQPTCPLCRAAISPQKQNTINNTCPDFNPKTHRLKIEKRKIRNRTKGNPRLRNILFKALKAKIGRLRQYPRMDADPNDV